jgi:uncharacterized protein
MTAMSLTATLVSSLIWQAALTSQGTGQTPTEQPVKLTTDTCTIHGTLLVPSVAGKIPVVLIIAGSGPTDRDGNSRALPGKNNMYTRLADSLAAEGIASLRYDKRAIGESNQY